MNTVRFITSDEVENIRFLYSIDRRSVGIEFTDDKITRIVEGSRRLIDEGRCHVPMIFDENNTPIGMYLGYEIQPAGAWYVGLTKILQPTNHFSKTAKILAPALNLLLEKMESRNLFKFWMSAPENWHNIRNKIMRRHSHMLDRYNWYDEFVIPRGKYSGVRAYDWYTSPCDWSDIVVRMFVLKQEHRVALLRNNQDLQDYQGTIFNSLDNSYNMIQAPQ